MKAGDLIELSVQGNKLDYLKNLRGLHGIVLRVLMQHEYVQVHWFGHAHPIIGMTFRKHLKFLKD